MTGRARVGDGDAFVKSASPAQLDAEAEGLAALRATRTVRVPALRGRRADARVLEWLDLRPLDARSGARLGAALADLHRSAVPAELAGRHGWLRDNFIGATPQLNTPNASWCAFWRECRLLPQLARAGAGGHHGRLQEHGARLVEVLDVLLDAHTPASSLLHGDLWGGNAGALAAGTPVIFDPAVYVGDRETDLAMSELLGGFPSAFHAAYQHAWPLDAGYAMRRELYNLYHLLNHLNLFGSGYLARCERTVARLLAEVR